MADGGPRLVIAVPNRDDAARDRNSPHRLHPYSASNSPTYSPTYHYSTQPATSMTSTSSPLSPRDDFGGVGTGVAYGGANVPRSPQASTGATNDNTSNTTSTPLSLNFLKSISDKKLTRDGQPAKRRGPKPDSKPALTRRQELNRQAQRTHRERKELYIKALEEEVLRLKEIFSNVTQDKDRLAEENSSLRVLLQQNGLALLDDNTSTPQRQQHQHQLQHLQPSPYHHDQQYIGSSSNHSSNASASGYGGGGDSRASHGGLTAYTSGSPPPPGSALSTNGAVQAALSPGVTALSLSPASTQTAGLTTTTSSTSGASPHVPAQMMLRRNPGIDYEQAGIDFVLTLEHPCMDHLPWLLERSYANGGLEPCGHALMASCPPEPFSVLPPDAPFGQPNHNHNHNYQSQNGGNGTVVARNQANGINNHGNSGNSKGGTTVVINDGENATALPTTWQLTKAGLATLLDLSLKLNLDGEITPVMAWGMVLGHPRLGELVERDFGRLSEELTGKVRCYGFGAVMEEFEVRDALEAVFSDKV